MIESLHKSLLNSPFSCPPYKRMNKSVKSEAQDDIGDDDDDDNNFIKVSCLIAKGFTNRGFFEVLSIPETMKLNST